MGSFGYTDVDKNEFSYMHRLVCDIENKKKIKIDGGDDVIFYNSNAIKNLKRLLAEKNANKVISYLKENVNNVFVDSKTNIGYRLTQIDKLPYSGKSIVESTLMIDAPILTFSRTLVNGFGLNSP